MKHGSVVLEHEGGAPKVQKVRGALLVASRQMLQQEGLFERYQSHLPEAQREALSFVLASSWYPAELAVAHYEACDALRLTELQMRTLGEAASQRIMDTYLGTILRTGRNLGAGASPWIPLKSIDRLWDRLFEGGSCVLRQKGPKDVAFEAFGVPMFRFRYFREGFVGMVRGAAGMFARTCLAREVARSGAPEDSMLITLSWV